MSLADTRTALAAALEDLSANVYPYPPAVVIPPAIVLVPADNYVEVATIGSSGARVIQRFRVTCAVAPIDNPATLDGLEQLMAEVLMAMPAGVGFDSGFTRPQMTSVGPSDLLTSDLTVSVMTTLTPESEQ